MKKIYLLFTIFVCQICVWGQVSIPIFNNFESTGCTAVPCANPGLGWTYITEGDSTSWDEMYFVGVGDKYSYSPTHSWFFSSMMDLYDSYLVSPQINYSGTDSINVRFKCSLETDYVGGEISEAYENFRIGYTTASTYNTPADFTWRTAMLSCTTTAWTDFSVNVPPTAKYVIIHYAGATLFCGMYVDDIYISPDEESEGWIVSVSANSGGTVSEGTHVENGDDYTLTAVADEGHYIASVTLDGALLPGSTSVTSFSYTVYNISENHVFDVTFAPIEFSIYLHPGEHGSISPDGGNMHQVLVPWGTDATFNFIPDDGYHVSDVWLNSSVHLGGISSYTFTNVTQNYDLYASFALNDYTIVATAGEGGTITPSGNVNVQAFANQSFTIIPNPGYLIDTTWVDGVELENITPQSWIYTFSEVAANHTISVVFAAQEYLVEYGCDANGSVTVSGGVVVDDHTRRVLYNDELTFNFQPNTGYRLTDIHIDNVSAGNSNPYVLTHVDHNCSVYGDFEELTYSINVVKHGIGEVAPMSVSNVNYFTSSTFTITPSFCQQIDSIKLDGAMVAVSSPLVLSELSGNHQLDVYFSYTYYPITIQPAEHGTITGPTEVICDGNAQFVMRPDPCYQMTSFLVDGVAQVGNIHTYLDRAEAIITHCSSAHNISAVFEKIPYTVTVTASGAGTISHLGSNVVDCGDDLAFTVVPDECHYVASLYVDNVDVTETVVHHPNGQAGLGDTLLFELSDITAAHNVTVTFAEFSYALTGQAGPQGRVEPAASNVLCAGSQTVTITPDACSHVATVTVDGADVTDQLQFNGGVATYIFNNVREPHTLVATFATDRYTVQVASLEHGTIIPNADSLVDCGTSFTFAVVPDQCYSVDTVWLDGVVINSQCVAHPNSNPIFGDSLFSTINNIVGNHTITAKCSPITYQVATNAIGHGRVTGTILNGRVQCGADLHYTITPDDCYAISRIIYNGDDYYDYVVGENGVVNLDFENIHNYSMLTAIFTMKTFVAEAVGEWENGLVMYDHGALNCGSTLEISYLPFDCYHLDSVYVNGLWIQPGQLVRDEFLAYYYLTDIQENPQLSAHFSIDSMHFAVTEGVELSVMDSMVACGQPLTCYAVRPDCQQFDSVKVNGVAMSEAAFQSVGTMTWRNDTVYFTFAELLEDISFGAFFSTVQYSLQTQVVGNGTVSYLGHTPLNCGDSIAIAIQPDPCHRFVQVTTETDVYPLDNDTLLIISDVRDNYFFTFEFAPITYQVTVSPATTYGRISAPTATEIVCGNHATYKFIPTSCGQLDSAWLDGQCINNQLDTINGEISFILDNIVSDHQLSATFIPKMYEIEVRNLEYATISQPAITWVECDSAYELRFTIDDCHELSNILIDGISNMGSMAVYTDEYRVEFQRVNENHLIELFYLEKSYTVRRIVAAGTNVFEDEFTVVPCGTDTTVSALWNDDCYAVSSVKINEIVTAVAPSYTFNDIHQDVTVYIDLQYNYYHIDVQYVANCEIVGPSFEEVIPCGQSATYHFHPAEGYYIVNLVVDGENVAAAPAYDFTNIHENHTISVIVAQNMYTLQTEAIGNGTLTPVNAVLPYGTDTVVRIIPDACYHIDSVWMNGNYVGAEAAYPIRLRENTFVTARFVRDSVLFEVHANDGGQVSMVGSHSVFCGEDVTLTLAPDDCFYLASFRVNGEERVGGLTAENNVYTVDLQNITEDYMVDVIFDHLRYNVTGNAGVGGQILSDVLAECGSDVTMIVKPDECYSIVSVEVNGVALPNVNPDVESYTFHNVRGDSTIQATFERREYSVTAMAGVGGRITPAGDSVVLCGDNITYHISPYTGYYIDYLLIDNEIMPAQAVYTFANVNARHTIEPVFARHKFYVLATSGNGGRMDPEGEITVYYGENQTINIIPNDCYSIDSVFVNGMYSGRMNSYTFNNVTNHQTISATFVRNEYSVQVAAGEGGTITPNNSTTILCGGSQTFVIVPEACHYIASILVDGVALTEFDATGTEFSFDNITSSHNIAVTFSAYNYQVTAQGGANGTVEVTEGSSVVCGGSRTINITPDPCYLIATLEVNGIALSDFNPAGATYTFNDIRGDSALVATFALSRDTLFVTANPHGSVSLPGENVLDCGSDFTLLITPDDCYRVRNVMIDGEYYLGTEPGEGDSKILTLNNIDRNHNIVVNFILKDYVVSTHTNIGGHISPMGAFPACGYTMEFTLEPFNCYEVDSVFIDGIPLPNSELVFDGPNATFYLTDIRQDHDIYVKFRGIQYQFDLQNNGNGIVEVSQEGADCEGDMIFSILPSDCERISEVILNGNDITSALIYHTNANPLLPDTAFYTISSVTEDQHLVVNYEGVPDKTISIFYKDGENMMASDTWAQSCGTNNTIDLTYDCYHLDSLIVNGIAVENPTATYNINHILADQTIEAYYTRNDYVVASIANDGGTITPNGNTTVLCGENQGYDITPNEGYYIDYVIVDGEQVAIQPHYDFNYVTENHTIEAHFAIYQYNIVATAGVNGAVTPAGTTTVNYGETLTVEVHADDCYSVDSVFVNGNYTGAMSSYTFEHITADQTLHATFVQNEYVITATSNEGGHITPNGSDTILCGGSQSYTITPDEGYYIDYLVVDGVQRAAQGAYGFSTITADHTIEAHFAIYTYTIVATAGANGSVTPAGTTTVNYGDTLTVNITSDDCYSIDSVFINGMYYGSMSSYTFEHVTADQSLRATFVQNQYVITTTASEGGTVIPNGSTTVTCGSSQTVTVRPDEGYNIVSIVIDGETVSVTDTVITFSNITADHSVAATFSQLVYTVTATAGLGGSISPATTNVAYGGNLSLQITPDACYEIAEITIDGTPVAINDVVTLENITANHSVNVIFNQLSYNIVATAGEGGTVTPSGTTNVICGSSQSVTVRPDEGYEIVSIVVDGEAAAVTDTVITFSNITADHSVTATFSQLVYTVTATAGAGGSITPTTATVVYGTDLSLPITHDACYEIAEITVNGTPVAISDTVVLTHITADQSVNVTFNQLSYSIVTTAGEGGTITPSGTTTLLCGDSQSVTVRRDEGYSIVSIVVDGESVAPTDTVITLSNISANHTVEVTFSQLVYTVTATAGLGGSISPTTANVAYGGNLSLQITPDDCYDIAEITINGTPVAITNTVTLNNITADQSVNVTFNHLSYNIVTSANAGGTITPNGTTTVDCGDHLTITVTPDEGYQIASIVVDGAPVADSIIDLWDIRDNHTIAATFSQLVYNVTATAGVGGSISPATTQVTYGSNCLLQITPDACYEIAEIIVNGTPVAISNPVILSHITADQSVNVTFNLLSYNIVATAGVGGTITPSGTTSVLCGDNMSVTIHPSEGYEIATIVVDGVALANIDSVVTFSDITANHTVAATFSQISYTVTGTAGVGGSISPATSQVLHGRNCMLLISPDACYEIAGITVNGTPVAISNPVILSNVTSDQDVVVAFNQLSYNIVASAGVGGTVTPSGTTNVLCGDSQSVTVRPNEGYRIANIVVDGVAVSVTDTVITFSDVTANHTVIATFTPLVYTVTATTGVGGSISPTSAQVTHGSSISLQITPDACYEIAEVMVNGTLVAISNPVELTNVTADQSVNVTFNQLSYNIVATAGEGGTVTPSGTTNVLCGGSQSVTIRPDEGYGIASIVVDGVAVSVTDTVITFSNISADHTVAATFSQLVYTVTATADVGGSISPATSQVVYGDSIALQITADDCYEIAGITVNGVPVAITDEILLQNVTADQSVNVSFNQLTYNVVVNVLLDDEMVFLHDIDLPCGIDSLIDVPTFDCFEPLYLMVNDSAIQEVSAYLIQNIRENQTLTFVLASQHFNIIVSQQGEGTISTTDTVTVSCARDTTFYFTPATGWFVQDVVVDGISQGTPTDNSFTLTNVIANHTLEVIFAINEYIITSTVDPINAGQISPYGSRIYQYGDTVTYTITPFPNYRIVSVEVDGVDVGAVSSYTFEFVDNNHNIVAHFETTGVEDVDNENITIYASGHTIHINNENAREINQIEVYDMQGRLVTKRGQCASSVEIDLSVAPGTYIVRVRTDHAILSRKLLITQW